MEHRPGLSQRLGVVANDPLLRSRPALVAAFTESVMAEHLSSPSLAPPPAACAAREAPGPASVALIQRHLLILLCLLAAAGNIFAQESLLQGQQTGPFV